MGVYPIIPGTDVWGLSTPAFDSIDITLDAEWFGTDELQIRAPGLSDQRRYVQSVTASGPAGAVIGSHLSGDELVTSGTLTFTVGDAPSEWATAAGSAPDAVVTSDAAPSRLWARMTPTHAAVVAGGSTTISVDVVAQGPAEVAGGIRVEGSADVSASVGDVSWAVSSQGSPVSKQVPVTLAIRPGVVAGTYPVVVDVTDQAGNAVELDATVTVADTEWLSAHFDSVGIGDARAANADFDGQGYYLLRDALAELGFVQGAAGVVPGTDSTFVVPAIPAGDPDNIRANGQTLVVPDAFRATASVSLIGATNNGDPHAGGAMTLTFTDGTSTQEPVELSDWCTPNPAAGNITVAKAGQRGDGRNGPQNIGCGIYATAPVPVPEIGR